MNNELIISTSIISTLLIFGIYISIQHYRILSNRYKILPIIMKTSRETQTDEEIRTIVVVINPNNEINLGLAFIETNT
jgi:hypothetical protein